MSRVAKMPLNLPKGVELQISGRKVMVKGPKGTLTTDLPPPMRLEVQGQTATIAAESIDANVALAGTMRANINNMIRGVTTGFEKRLALVGVGYRAAVQGRKLNLSVGLSHPIEYAIPPEITIEAPSQTEIVIKGSDKQQVGLVAAQIRSYRPPEPYKGKGVRYANEQVSLKEAKKK